MSEFDRMKADYDRMRAKEREDIIAEATAVLRAEVDQLRAVADAARAFSEMRPHLSSEMGSTVAEAYDRLNALDAALAALDGGK